MAIEAETGDVLWQKDCAVAPMTLPADGMHVYGFGRKPAYFRQSSVLEYQLFATDKRSKRESIQRINDVARRMDTCSKTDKLRLRIGDGGIA